MTKSKTCVSENEIFSAKWRIVLIFEQGMQREKPGGNGE